MKKRRNRPNEGGRENREASKVEPVEFDGKKYNGIRQEIGNLTLIVVRAKRGYIACSYVSKETAEKVGDIAAFVSGVNTYSDFFNAKIKHTTTWADDMGIREGMSVRKALEIIKEDLEISFAHQGFKWTNNAKNSAAVICVVIGVRNRSKKKKYLFKNDR